MSQSKRILNNQSGFTLIEIIAVLVLLGILAAVAVPKYTSMMDEAKLKSAQTAIAEAKAQVNQYSAKYILATGDVPTTLANLQSQGLAPDGTYDAEDFTITFSTQVTDTDGNIYIPISVVSTTDTEITATGRAYLPKTEATETTTTE